LTEEAKLHLALMQIHNMISLLKGNEYEVFLYSKLYKMKCELERQLSLLTNSKQQSTIKE
jgi:hypothetical protein